MGEVSLGRDSEHMDLSPDSGEVGFTSSEHVGILTD